MTRRTIGGKVAPLVLLTFTTVATADGPFTAYTLPPCRIFDTRTPSGPTLGAPLSSGVLTGFTIQDRCGVPLGAKGAFFNVTAVSPGGDGYLTLFPSGLTPTPTTSTINFMSGASAIANGAFVSLSTNPADPAQVWVMPSVLGSGKVHMLLDVAGYIDRNKAAAGMDFNRDGKSDLLCRVPSTGTNYVATSNGPGNPWGGGGIWLNNWCSTGSTLLTGDFNGDGLADLICHTPASGTNYVAINNGASAFVDGTVWLSGWCVGPQFGVGDFNGDGKTDLYCHETNGNTWVALSNGAGAFTGGGIWGVNGQPWCAGPQFGVGDFNGDGRADLYCHDGAFDTYIALSNGTSFVGGTRWLSNWCNVQFAPGDFNGDGKSDFYCHYDNGANYVVVSNGVNAFTGGTIWLTNGFPWCSGAQLGAGDLNGDGMSDLLCHSTSGANWVALSNGVNAFTNGTDWGAWCPNGELSPAR